MNPRFFELIATALVLLHIDTAFSQHGSAISGLAPYHAAIEGIDSKGIWSFTCSGAILDKFWILTASSCVLKSPRSYRIRYDTIRKNIGRIEKVDLIIHHPKVDLALIYLPADKPLKLNSPNARAVKLPNYKFLSIANLTINVTGWNERSLLEHQEQQLLSTEHCSIEHVGADLNDSFCTSAGSNCFMDLGSPAVRHNILEGIAKSKQSCNQRNESVLFTKVQPYRDWIYQVAYL